MYICLRIIVQAISICFIQKLYRVVNFFISFFVQVVSVSSTVKLSCVESSLFLIAFCSTVFDHCCSRACSRYHFRSSLASASGARCARKSLCGQGNSSAKTLPLRSPRMGCSVVSLYKYCFSYFNSVFFIRTEREV